MSQHYYVRLPVISYLLDNYDDFSEPVVLIERILDAVNNASFPIGKISIFLQHDTKIMITLCEEIQ